MQNFISTVDNYVNNILIPTVVGVAEGAVAGTKALGSGLGAIASEAGHGIMGSVSSLGAATSGLFAGKESAASSVSQGLGLGHSAPSTPAVSIPAPDYKSMLAGVNIARLEAPALSFSAVDDLSAQSVPFNRGVQSYGGMQMG